MIYIVINVLAIAAATIASLAFGIMYHRGVTQLKCPPLVAPPEKLLPLAALACIAEFWFASILAGALILAPPEAGRWTMALGTAVVVWIGFVAPVLLVTHRYRGLSSRAALSDSGHWLGVMIIQAVVLQWIGLQPPPV